MIQNEQECRAALRRMERFQRRLGPQRQAETNPHRYRLSVGGYLAELARMPLEVREYLWSHPTERTGLAVAN